MIATDLLLLILSLPVLLLGLLLTILGRRQVPGPPPEPDVEARLSVAGIQGGMPPSYHQTRIRLIGFAFIALAAVAFILALLP